MPITNSSPYGGFRLGSILLNVASPPVPGPTRSTTVEAGPGVATQRETTAVGAAGSPYARRSRFSWLADRRYPATSVMWARSANSHRRVALGSNVFQLTPLVE